MDSPRIDDDNFWAKIRATAGRLPFLDEVVATWFAARDPRTPVRVKAILLGALAYFVLPADLVPDIVLGLGYTDDLGVLVAAWQAVRPWITDDHRASARAALKSM